MLALVVDDAARMSSSADVPAGVSASASFSIARPARPNNRRRMPIEERPTGRPGTLAREAAPRARRRGAVRQTACPVSAKERRIAAAAGAANMLRSVIARRCSIPPRLELVVGGRRRRRPELARARLVSVLAGSAKKPR
jgi:hypothetical protein